MIKLKVGARVKVLSKDIWGSFDRSKKINATLVAVTRGQPPYCVRFDEENSFSHNYYPKPTECIAHTGEKKIDKNVYWYYNENDITPISKEIVIDFES